MSKSFSLASFLIVALFLIDCTRVTVVSNKNWPADAQIDAVKKNDLAKPKDTSTGEIIIRDAKNNDTQRLDLSNRDILDSNRLDLSNRDILDSNRLDLSNRDILARDGGIVPGTWVTINSGTFLMGSPALEACRYSNETQHQVTLTHAFEMQTTEVTQGQFLTIRGYNPSNFASCGNNCPVERVSWHEAVAYCNAISINRGYATCYDCSGSGTLVTCSPNASFTSGNIYQCSGYRLPTEAEWEYAYRAGTTTGLHNGKNVNNANCKSSDANANEISWNWYNSSSTTHAVGSTSTPNTVNAWGLYDMAGNVWEWANDWWDGSTPYSTAAVTDPWGLNPGAANCRVTRSGGWTIDPAAMRAAYRDCWGPTNKDYNVGFRCARTR